MEESALPESLRMKASVSVGGEHAWRMEDVEEVVLAARDIGLACLGGQLQFQFPDGICEAYWIAFDSTERQANEPWEHFVSRSAEEALWKFRQVCRDTDFQGIARKWGFISQKMDREGCDPKDYLWFPLYFQAQPAS
jgi:hypothetical protein